MKRILLFGGLALVAAPALAHHSFAMYDVSKTETISGTVQQFRWSNPHVVIVVATAGPAPQTWSVELTSPGNLRRVGWTRHSLTPGQSVSLEIYPLRDGSHGGGYQSGHLADGTSLGPP